MLKLTLEIHEDGKDAITQARALVTTLHSLYGSAILPVPVTIVGHPDLPKGPQPAVSYATPAPDGQPMTANEAATVFGTAQTVETDEDGPEQPATGELDSNGFPWDARIHSEARGQNKDGTWRNRRNLDKTILETVTKELEAAKTQRTLNAAQGLIPQPPAPTPAPPPPVPAPTAASPVPSPAPAPASASSTAPAPASGNPFVALMTRVTKAQAAGVLQPETLASFFAAVGVAQISEMLAKKEIIPDFNALLDTVPGA